MQKKPGVISDSAMLSRIVGKKPIHDLKHRPRDRRSLRHMAHDATGNPAASGIQAPAKSREARVMQEPDVLSDVILIKKAARNYERAAFFISE